MQALLLRHFGDLSQLHIEELPTPTPGPDELLIAVRAALINPSDVKNVEGTMHGTTLPRIPGRDFAGTVLQGPPDLLHTDVFGTGGDLGFTRDGSHAQFLLLPRAAVTPKPPALSMDAAGCAGVTFITAWSALITAAQLAAGETTLVIGATGGVGAAAVQIAKARGAPVIAAVRSDTDIPLARQHGADHVINTKTTPLAPAVLAATDNQGANVLFDTSGMMLADTLDAAALHARIPIITAPKDGQAALNLRTLYRKTLHLVGVDTRQLDATACATLLTTMLPHFAAAQFRPLHAIPFPFTEAATAYTQTAQGKKTLLHPQP